MSRYSARHNYRQRCALTVPIRGPLGSSQVRLPSIPHCSTSVLTHLSPWSYYVPMFGVFVNLGLLYWKRHQHPLNLILLSTFTLLESFTLGILCAYFDSTVVLQALYVGLFPTVCGGTLTSPYRLITLGVFLGLTVFTFQSKVRWT